MIYNVYMEDLMRHRSLRGFTLAEVLITLSVIGIVAAVTLPTLLTDIHENVRARSATVFARKISESIETMQAAEKLSGYIDTAEFVDELRSYLKITKVCDFDHLTECWPYEKIKLYDGSSYNINTINVGEVLFQTGEVDPNGNAADYTSKVMAFNIVDGTSVIIGYNTKCNEYDPHAIENCYVALFEINGRKSPNTVGQDAILMNATHFVSEEERNLNGPGIECTGNICSNSSNSGFATPFNGDISRRP